ncbi:hypothetical protein [Tenacibaculum piscium]|uniref:Uncharacterized protein n=1 Tax=Tenacibaculum piscium TaxID=1458515 RepID=A0A2H1YIC6_9FLAO|nr:hypothetical protein [Tenacibaculum piscium]MBE7630488.1 hypothetical protein [Tenacibaculum piscium]MBE7671675.1 hypothetical protein [Tenacibaculum piscium]MBE7686529.1 hypothetical protein [Tenacibaculum piscium]SOS74567.1 hypothetical protein TNO020_200001 [Tenacibaculum piscium]
MNFEKALKRKKQLGKYKDGDLDMTIYIAPKRDKDYELFLNDFLKITDRIELAKGHSVNQEFRLCAIWEGKNSIRDIPNI